MKKKYLEIFLVELKLLKYHKYIYEGVVLMLMGKRIIVTGASGFIGSHLIKIGRAHV